MLLGGDYTEGVKGVGIVNGMEVLQAFDCSNNVKDGLSKFRSWLDGFDPDDACKDRSKNSEEKLTAEQLFRRKHKTARTQWVAPKNFPADNVLSAYLKPVVDTSTDRFSWGAPDLDRLLVFCERNMGWNPRETRKLLDPVIERLADTSRQTRLESHFMTVGQDIRFATIKSKRLREVFQGIQKKSSSTTEDKKSSRRKRMRADES
jgi:DNA excision repair protein ERCC-5